MPRTLETLTSGTPVFCGEARVGAVRAVYAEGDTRSAALIVVDWNGRPAPVSLPANEVMTVDEQGVTLMNADPNIYASLVEFDEARFPTVHRLA